MKFAFTRKLHNIFLLQLVNATEQFASVGPITKYDVSMILKETQKVKNYETERLQLVF